MIELGMHILEAVSKKEAVLMGQSISVPEVQEASHSRERLALLPVVPLQRSFTAHTAVSVYCVDTSICPSFFMAPYTILQCLMMALALCSVPVDFTTVLDLEWLNSKIKEDTFTGNTAAASCASLAKRTYKM